MVTTTTGRIRPPRMVAWMITHDSHGTYWDSLFFLPVGEKPEGYEAEKCVRVPWLDEPEKP